MAKSFLEFDAGAFFRNINRRFARNVRGKIIPQIVDRIESGRSPVRGYGAYQKYSPEYQDKIKKGKYRKYGKRIRPVNLTLSGKMLKAFKVRALVNGGVSIFNANKLAKYHNDEGAGRSQVIRKMLPGRNEQFTKVIQDNINQQLERAIKDAFRV